jgi:cell surface protein SprA
LLQSFNISHGYRSTYSINSYSVNLLFPQGVSSDFSNARDTVGNFISRLDYQTISVAEQFAPLIGIDMTFQNSLQARFEIKKDRTVALTYSNIQVTEVRGTEYTIGTGYRIRKFKLPFIKVGASKSSLANDLNLRGDFSLRTNTTLIRKLVENANEPSAGSTAISVKLSADYNINERFNIKLFADKIINNPFVSTSFPTSNLNAGFSVRFTLAQ